MGIDIEFQAVIPKVLTETEVAELYEEMKDKFNVEVCVDRIKIVPQSVLCLDEDFKIPEGHTLLDFHTLCRLYGKYYERGNPMPWITFAEFIEFKYPGSWCSYTGDSYHQIFPWTKEDREELKLHFFQHGTKPYYDKNYRAHLIKDSNG